MRIVAGSAKGRKLFTPIGMDIRPTTDKVKEAMFSILQFDLPDKRVLDLFAGTGQLGIEAISRGAAFAYFTDASRKAVELINKNVDAAGFRQSSRVIQTDAFTFLNACGEKFDIVLLDPPYENGLCTRAFESLPRILNEHSIVVCETRPEETLPASIGALQLAKQYKYSNIRLSVYRNPEVVH